MIEDLDSIDWETKNTLENNTSNDSETKEPIKGQNTVSPEIINQKINAILELIDNFDSEAEDLLDELINLVDKSLSKQLSQIRSMINVFNFTEAKELLLKVKDKL